MKKKLMGSYYAQKRKENKKRTIFGRHIRRLFFSFNIKTKKKKGTDKKIKKGKTLQFHCSCCQNKKKS